MRLIAYTLTGYIAFRIYNDPSVFFESFFHPHYPTDHAYVYNRGIPK
jgi:hypothetical protein